jgi:pyruvate ferredoxin oxidoreductase alpha subunit
VLDRAISLGGANAPVTSEIRALLYDEPKKPKVHCMIAGIGQRDVTPEDVVKMVEMALSGNFDYHIYGVRG